jgi:hypothetical protein
MKFKYWVHSVFLCAAFLFPAMSYAVTCRCEARDISAPEGPNLFFKADCSKDSTFTEFDGSDCSRHPRIPVYTWNASKPGVCERVVEDPTDPKYSAIDVSWICRPKGQD